MTGTVVISPHLDDAVFGCGHWLAAHPGALVVTVFAGVPREPAMATDWDTRCGFTSAGQAMAERRREDRAALALLGAEPLWLDHCDSQYAQTSSAGEIAATLREVFAEARPERVLLPLGLFHSDHLLAHTGARQALGEAPAGLAIWAYEDALYRRHAGLLQMRLCDLRQAGVEATPLAASEEPAGPLKQRAVAAYASQLRALGDTGWDDTRRPERFWALARREPADG